MESEFAELNPILVLIVDLTREVLNFQVHQQYESADTEAGPELKVEVASTCPGTTVAPAFLFYRVIWSTIFFGNPISDSASNAVKLRNKGA